jgi:hypothetical protein
MRLVKTGPTDLRVIQIVDGVKEGDEILMLGSILSKKPEMPPKLEISENMKRGAPTKPSQAEAMTTPTKGPAGKQAGTAPARGKTTKP